MDTNKPLLSVDQLTIRFSQEGLEKKVIDSLSFQLFPGETLGIVGESGSGKSLTALSIMDLLPEAAEKESGRLYFNPIRDDLWQQSPEAMRGVRGAQIGMIFQEPMTALNPVFRCGPQIQEAISLHHKLYTKAAKDQTLAWMVKVGLQDTRRIYEAYPHQLSGGQKQRILLAMALCGQPQLLIADEPTTALDVTVQQKILELLQKLKTEESLSLLFISHDLAVVAEVADRVLVMQKGRLVESGPTREVFANPRHPYTRGLVACKPQLGKHYHRLPTMQEFLSEDSSPQKQDIISVTTQKENSGHFLSVQDLVVEYGHKKNWWSATQPGLRAVNGVSFDIEKGETLGLVGESGCGKSTLAKTIARLIKPNQGTLFLEGLPYEELVNNRDFYRKVQIIFQDPYSSLNPRMPVGEAITEPMAVHQIASSSAQRKDKAVALLETVGLEADDYRKYPHQFSGGQRQRISIARALSVDPQFIICDEVVSALDVSVQAIVLNLLKDIQEQNKLTYLFISHDLAVVQFISDRIAVMRKGEIVELSDTRSIYEQAAHPYTRELIDAIPGG
ncbi:MAG TPA: ABC transporter ATP-binding protein [Saprospiraceae bacterium]|nr:ABC transporter ATP-binding protein [Saprospiraceae bacterium]